MEASSLANGLLPSLQVFATSTNAGQTGRPWPGPPGPIFCGRGGRGPGTGVSPELSQ